MRTAYDLFDVGESGDLTLKYYDEVDIGNCYAEASATSVTSLVGYSVLSEGASVYKSTASTADCGYSSEDELEHTHETNALQASRLRRSLPFEEDVTARPMDWNEAFQRLVEEDDSYEKYCELRKLAHDFVFAAASYGKIIISEMALPDERKTIKACDVGGTAGGEKYIAQGIFFKFALDIHSLYGGDEFAMKAASHDLKGLINYYNCSIEGLCVPLMALIDYMGFRLIAISILPISKTTLCYGSCDGGHTVETRYAECNALFEAAAVKMNVKKHRVGVTSLCAKDLCAPVDIEGHRGTDFRYYVLDFARSFPPEKPTAASMSQKGSILYRLLRPELVRSNNVPLSPDVWSFWSRVDPLKDEHNKEVEAATDRLYIDVIPAFALHVDEADSKADSLSAASSFSFVEMLHSRGINVRHLGHLRTHVNNPIPRALILEEMVARIVKNFVRSEFRAEVRKNTRLSEEPLREAVSYVFNIILGTNAAAAHMFWTTEIKAKIAEKFGVGLGEEEKAPDFDLSKSLDVFKLIVRIQKLLNIRLSNNLLSWIERVRSQEDYTPKVVLSDITTFEPRLKHMNLVDIADGTALLYESRREVELGTKTRLLARALDKFVEATRKHPLDTHIFLTIGNELLDVARKRKPDDEVPWLEKKNVLFHIANRAHEHAVHAFQHGLALDPTSSACTAGIAAALHLLGRDAQGETIKKCKEALALDTSNAQAYGILGEIHSKNYDWADAVAMFDQALLHTQTPSLVENSVRAKLELLVAECYKKPRPVDRAELSSQIEELFGSMKDVLSDMDATTIPIDKIRLTAFWVGLLLILQAYPPFHRVIDSASKGTPVLSIRVDQNMLPLTAEDMISLLPYLSDVLELEFIGLDVYDTEQYMSALSEFLSISSNKFTKLELERCALPGQLLHGLSAVGARLTKLRLDNVSDISEPGLAALPAALSNLQSIDFQNFPISEHVLIEFVRQNHAQLNSFVASNCWLPGTDAEKLASASDALLAALPETLEVLELENQTRLSSGALDTYLARVTGLKQLNVTGLIGLDVHDLVVALPDRCLSLNKLITPCGKCLVYAGGRTSVAVLPEHSAVSNYPLSFCGTQHTTGFAAGGRFMSVSLGGRIIPLRSNVRGTVGHAIQQVFADLTGMPPLVKIECKQMSGQATISTTSVFPYLHKLEYRRFGAHSRTRIKPPKLPIVFSPNPGFSFQFGVKESTEVNVCLTALYIMAVAWDKFSKQSYS